MDMRETWEILSYVVTVIGLPFAIAVFIYEQRRERRNEDEEIFQRLSDEYREFLKLVLDNSDLQLLRREGARRDFTEEQKERRLAIFGILAPFGANAAGWIFTEMGRQPFVVVPNPNPSGVDGVFMFTAAAVSPGVDGREVVFSLVTLGLVYLVLMIVEVALIARFVRAGVAGVMPERFGAPDADADGGDDDTGDRDDVLAFAY